jgi:hypothetical protein
MSNRSLLEFNHDLCPPKADKAMLEWAWKIRNYLTCYDPRHLPKGVERKWIRHHSEPCPVERFTEMDTP